MRLRARHRLRISVLVLLSLLFQQAALAAYVCPTDQMPSTMEAMAGHCAEMGMSRAQDNPALCAKHCAPDLATTVDHTQLSVPTLALPPTLFAPVVLQATSLVAVRTEVPLKQSDPPPRLRYCSLLI